ncbi:hypothetical protein ACIBTP_39910 [Streptomyces avidinii]|uniref:hypothetical protein n=1 Tax=Streptomyces avidinii TaxID=1895 RepID=UPI003797D6F4
MTGQGHRPWQTSASDYRMILVEGVAPDELPALLGSEPGTLLSPPLRQWDVTRYHRPDQRVFSSYDDKPLLSVGRAGPDWSFAFEQDPSARFDTERFVSPAPAASAGGGRAIVIWHEWHQDTPLFHVSAAEGGTLRYAFTVSAGTLNATVGDVPAELTSPALGFDAPTRTARPQRRPAPWMSSPCFTESPCPASPSPRAGCTPSSHSPGAAHPAPERHT